MAESARRAFRLGDGLTWADWARLVAADVGVHGLSDETVETLLWEHTAFPFADARELRPQLVAALIGPPFCPRCGDRHRGPCGPEAAQGH